VVTANGHKPAAAEPELLSLTPGKLARRLNGEHVLPNLWANRGLIGSTLGSLLSTVVADRHGSRYRLFGHLWLEMQRFLAPGIRNVDLADLRVDSTMVEGDVSRHDRLILCAMGKLLASRTIFEIGTFQGQTTWHLARNNPQARIYTLDLPSLAAAQELKYDLTDPEYFVEWKRGIRFAGTPEAARITQLFGDSARFDFSPYHGTIDLIFIDGSHSYDYVKSDTEAAFRMLSDQGTIVWDDYLYYPGMYRLLNQLSPTLDRPIFHIVGTRLAVYSRVDILNAGWPALR
jgi:predicted O-methyltransferase YrrM